MRMPAFIPLVVALLAGCTLHPPYGQSVERLNAVPVCCATIKDIPIFASLKSKLSAPLDETSPVFDFATGRSAFFAFALPALSGPYVLEVSTYPREPFDMRPLRPAAASPSATALEPLNVKTDLGYRFFYPVVLFLDEDRQPLSIGEDTHMTMRSGHGWSFEAAINVPSRARFAILHTPSSKIGQIYETSRMERLCSYVGYGAICRDEPVFLRAQFGPVGDVAVSLKSP